MGHLPPGAGPPAGRCARVSCGLWAERGWGLAVHGAHLACAGTQACPGCGGGCCDPPHACEPWSPRSAVPAHLSQCPGGRHRGRRVCPCGGHQRPHTVGLPEPSRGPCGEDPWVPQICSCSPCHHSDPRRWHPVPALLLFSISQGVAERGGFTCTCGPCASPRGGARMRARPGPGHVLVCLRLAALPCSSQTPRRATPVPREGTASPAACPFTAVTFRWTKFFIVAIALGAGILAPCVVGLTAPRMADTPCPAFPASTHHKPKPRSQGSVSLRLAPPTAHALRSAGRAAWASARPVRGSLPSLWLGPCLCQDHTPRGLHFRSPAWSLERRRRKFPPCPSQTVASAGES